MKARTRNLAEPFGTVDRSAEVGLSVFQSLLADYHPRDFAVRMWNGSLWEAEAGQPTRFTLVMKHPRVLHRIFWFPNDVTLGEAYLDDDFDIEGDICAVFGLRDYITDPQFCFRRWLCRARILIDIPFIDLCRHRARPLARLQGDRHSIERDRQAVTAHYDLSNEFFSLWLDPEMVYSCAYFDHTAQDLDEAQVSKLDYICRKLRLRPGERLLDIGCGWGGLVMHAARRYGVYARGITLSRQQAELAARRIAEAGLSDRCRVDIADYREIDEPCGYDKLVSVGMFEHVGQSRLSDYFSRAWRLLRSPGVFLNHGIAASVSYLKKAGPSFVDKYVFPDGELLPISTSLKAAEESGFEVRDVESLREHYALTLRHWVRRLEARREEVRRLVGEVTYRVWRLYMAGSAHGFATGRISVFQSLLAKCEGGMSGLPLKRADWYV